MAIYGIGSFFGGNTDVAAKFIKDGVAGSDWGLADAPDIHQIIISLRVGDIIYIKSCSAASKSIYVSAIGFIKDTEILTANNVSYFEIGRNVLWKYTPNTRLSIPKYDGKNNVRSNTIYQEFHPKVQVDILRKLI